MKWLRIGLPIVTFPLGPLTGVLLLAFGTNMLGGGPPVALVVGFMGLCAPTAFRMLGLAPYGGRTLLAAPLIVPLAGVLHLVAWVVTVMALFRNGLNFMGGSRLDWTDLLFAATAWIVASTVGAALIGALESSVLRDRRAMPHVVIAHLAWIVVGLSLICGFIGQEATGLNSNSWIAGACGLVALVAVFGTPLLSAAAVGFLESSVPESAN